MSSFCFLHVLWGLRFKLKKVFSDTSDDYHFATLGQATIVSLAFYDSLLTGLPASTPARLCPRGQNNPFETCQIISIVCSKPSKASHPQNSHYKELSLILHDFFKISILRFNLCKIKCIILRVQFDEF